MIVVGIIVAMGCVWVGLWVGLSVDIAHYVRLVMASRVTVGFGQLCPAQGARPLASCCCFKG